MTQPTYPTTQGVVAFFAEREAAGAAARDLLAAPEGGAAAPRTLTLHTALPGHNGEWTGVVRASGNVEALAASLATTADRGLYAAELRSIKAHPITWAPGEPSPGIGLLFAAKRRPDLSHEEYDAHWRDGHAPLALRHHIGMWDYTQCSFQRALSDTSPVLDGLAICQFATVEDYKERFFDSDEGRAVIEADVRKFADVGASPTMRMTETILRR